MPIGALAAAVGAVGVGQAGLGIVGARRTQKRTSRAIAKAYKRADRRLVQQQGDVRAGTNESLIARGLVTGGQESLAGAFLPTSGKALLPGGPGSIAQGILAQRQGNLNRVANFAPESRGGMIGERNTLAGSIGSDLSKEFELERLDLNSAKNDAKRANNAQFMSSAMGAIAGGVQSGLGLYSAFSQPRPGTAGGAGAAAAPATGGLRGAFGIDPADPLSSFGVETSVADFHVKPRSY